MEIHKRLQELNSDGSNLPKIKKYLIDCCSKYAKYRSSGNLEGGIQVAKRFISGRATWRELHRPEWILEGEAFGVEFYIDGPGYFRFHPNKFMLSDLKKIRLGERLSQEDAKKYLLSLSYFIVYVFSYCYRAPRDLPGQSYSKFLCPVLFKERFG